ncbi:uncharacterized protein LOC142973388 [Anticarsia gemmatalis]|uniref:uncharacterized protein LOC142973388 n=1 Tax=Anticarsia gemmatalis TaxID=129554 RepID=UPI003F76DD57
MYWSGSFLVILAIVSSVFAANSTAVENLRKARRGLRDCHDDIMMVNADNSTVRTCTDNRDLRKKIDEYISAVKQTLGQEVNVNEEVIDLLEFGRNHTYFVDFIFKSSCKNTTMEDKCSNDVLGVRYDLSGQKEPEKVNFVKQLFHPKENPKYTVMSCANELLIKECVRTEALKECDNNTKTFVMDLYDHSHKHCKNKASSLDFATLLFINILAITITILRL